MSRIEGFTVVQSTDTFVHQRVATQHNRGVKAAVLLAYAAGGWAILVGVAYLLLETL